MGIDFNKLYYWECPHCHEIYSVFGLSLKHYSNLCETSTILYCLKGVDESGRHRLSYSLVFDRVKCLLCDVCATCTHKPSCSKMAEGKSSIPSVEPLTYVPGVKSISYVFLF